MFPFGGWHYQNRIMKGTIDVAKTTEALNVQDGALASTHATNHREPNPEHGSVALRLAAPTRVAPRRLASSRLAMVGQVIALVSDIGSAWLAFAIAYVLRYPLEFGGDIQPADWEPLSTFFEPMSVALVLTVIVFTMRGAYAVKHRIGLLDQTWTVIGGFTTVMAGVVMLAFFLRFAPSRLVFLYAWICGIALMVLHRAAFRAVQRALWRRGIGVDRVLVVGAGQNGRRVLQAMSSRPDFGYRVVGFADDISHGERVNVATERGTVVCPRLGFPHELDELVQRHAVDEVVIALPGADHHQVLDIIERCRQSVVTFRVIPDLLQLSLDRVDLGEVAGVPIIGVRDASIRGWHAFVKRTSDIVLASVVLTVMALPMAVFAALIKIDSEGSVFYRQHRVGQNGRVFRLLKFRCMVSDADELREALLLQHEGVDPRMFKLRDDPRITRVGRTLRRLSLDELPQFIHVLKGEMSVIGPRPPLPKEVADYEEWHHQRLLVKPGLTGLWQVNGRSELSFDEMVRLDLYYAENWSPWLDTKIVLRTIPAVLRGRGAF
jgi:exopolysaccharide biosynthesis polyprenyl glycosylphosphotransferase